MSDLRKAAEMALEFVTWFASDDHSIRPKHKAPEIAEALRQALNVDAVNMSQERVDETAKREHEPVAWQDTSKYSELVPPEVWENIDPQWHFMYRPLYTAPPKREWVGLTEEEQQKLYDEWQKRMDGWGSFYKAIEVKLKEKNDG